MKLMFYINTISHGGAERVIVNLATQLSQRGHKCYLVTSYYTPEFEYPVGDDVKRLVLSERRIENVIRRNVTYVNRLRKLLKQHQPDVLISFMPEANYRSLMAVMGLKTSVIISVRNDPNREYGSAKGKMLAKTLYKTTDGIVFQTQEAKDWFPKSIQCKGIIIYNQVGEQFYQQHLSPERRDIVATGRLTKQKNHRMLIDAYANISGKTDERLVIYGEGPLREDLERRIKDCHLEDKVVLMGQTEDVPEVLKKAKIYVLSSDYEGMPNALMEAMAMGLPCVSTDCPCGGPKMLFGAELKDWLVPVNNDQMMGRKIMELLANDTVRDKVGDMFKRKADEFRPHVIIQKWEDFISMVNQKGNRF